MKKTGFTGFVLWVKFPGVEPTPLYNCCSLGPATIAQAKADGLRTFDKNRNKYRNSEHNLLRAAWEDAVPYSLHYTLIDDRNIVQGFGEELLFLPA